MELQRDCEYLYEEIKKCHMCKHYIENKFHRVRVCNRVPYYHRDCFALMIKKMERLGMC